MLFLNFGAGEIWQTVMESLNRDGHITSSFSLPFTDVVSEKQVEAAFQYIAENSFDFKPDWVIYTAGISHIQTIEGMDLEKVVDEFCSNALGALTVAKYMKKYGVKNFIAIDSVAGLYGKANHAGYSASKAALRSIVQSMGMEGFNAYAISPGRVDTTMREADYPGEDKRTRLKPSQIAAVVTEILEGRYAPGDNIIIRKRGFRTLRRVDRGEPWRDYLNVQPLDS